MDALINNAENKIFVYEMAKDYADSLPSKELGRFLTRLRDLGCPAMATSIVDALTDEDGRSKKFKMEMSQKGRFHDAIHGQESTELILTNK